MRTLSSFAVTAMLIGLVHGCSSSSRTPAQFGDPTEPASGTGIGGSGALGGGGDPSAAPANNVCSNTEVKFALAPVAIEFVVDRSASMADSNKWTAMTAAMREIFAQMRMTADQTTGVGLLLFAADNAETKSASYPDPVRDVPMGLVDDAQLLRLNTRLSVQPTTDTPTYPAMQGGYHFLETLVPTASVPTGAKKVLALFTDGDPNNDGLTKSNRMAAYRKLAADELAKGILTFVVGIGSGSDVNPQFLGAVAQAGGTGAPTCDPNEARDTTKMCYLPIFPGARTATQLKDDFVAALNQIRRAASACEYGLQQDLSADPNKVNVEITSTDAAGHATKTQVAKDPADGWTFDNDAAPTKIYLHGSSCTEASTQLDVKVDVLFGCQTMLR